MKKIIYIIVFLSLNILSYSKLSEKDILDVNNAVIKQLRTKYIKTDVLKTTVYPEILILRPSEYAGKKNKFLNRQYSYYSYNILLNNIYEPYLKTEIRFVDKSMNDKVILKLKKDIIKGVN